MQKESEELQPRPFFNDLPPRRMGLKVIKLLAALFAGVYLATLLYIAGDNWSFTHRDVPATMDPEARKQDFAHHDEAQRRLWDWSEKIEMAVISLLGAAVGYSLKREV